MSKTVWTIHEKIGIADNHLISVCKDKKTAQRLLGDFSKNWLGIISNSSITTDSGTWIEVSNENGVKTILKADEWNIEK